MSDQEKDGSGSNRERVCVYFPKELAGELREIVKGLPFGATLSGFLESAVRREIDRVKQEGLYKPPKK